MKIKLGIIFGGPTVEHEVSIVTALQAIEYVNQDKYEIVPIYITKNNEWYTGDCLSDIRLYKDIDSLLKKSKNVVLYKKDSEFILQSKGLFKKVVNKIDIAFPITHGTNVEDGVLQGYLETIGIPHVGSDVYGSIVAQDKQYMKELFKGSDIPQTNFVWFYDVDFEDNKKDVMKKINTLKYPLIIKPSTTGSSVGISICEDEKTLLDAIEEAIKYDKKIIIEEAISDLKEFNVAVLGNYTYQKTSEIDEVFSKNKFLTYEDKYLGSSSSKKGTPVKGGDSSKLGMDNSDRKLPADISSKLRKEIEETAKMAFKTLGSSGNARIDFLYDNKKKKLYLNEINSIPGSLAFYLWNVKGLKYTDLLEEMISIGIKDFNKREKTTYSFDSNLLSLMENGFSGCKKGKK